MTDETAEPAPPAPPDPAVPSLASAIGGPLGAAESALPAAAFVAVYSVGGNDVEASAIVAVALTAVLAAARIVRGQTIQYALSGLVGVLFAGFVATRTGRAEDFFLPGLLSNLAYGSAFVISIVLRRPLVGYLASMLAGGDTYKAWREDPTFVKAATRASWICAGVFFLRLAVQLPLYFADALVALGTAKIAMGIPLFALGAWLSFLVMRPVLHAHGPTTPATPTASA